MGTCRDAVCATPEGATILGPERPRTYDELDDNDKARFNADVRATNIVLQGLPKDIYKLINHNIEAKAIWDNGLAKQIKCYNCSGFGHISRNYTQPKRPQNFDYFKDKMMLMQAQENGVVLDEEELLFLAGDHANTFDVDVDEQPVRDMAQNDDNIFQADECDAFNSDIDDEPTTQTIFMANHHVDVNHEEHKIDNEVQQPTVVDSDTVEKATELAIYKEQVEVYEQRAKFEITKYEQKLNEQIGILIHTRNRNEENLKKALQSVKLQLNSTIQSNKLVQENVTALQQDFKQKEDKLLGELVNMRNLKEKFKDKLYKQEQSMQTIHMLCKPKSLYDHENKMALGYQNPYYLNKATRAQPVLYDGHEILKTNHVPAIVPTSEEDLELADISKEKMIEKVKDPECVKWNITHNPLNYSKANFIVTFKPQTTLISEQVFWSKDLFKKRVEALKAKAYP
nr:integrase, catalytic region, zinc finger, CCHC-type, peptidase aspartic, catalytic [Tanacetum cinerariifolium]